MVTLFLIIFLVAFIFFSVQFARKIHPNYGPEDGISILYGFLIASFSMLFIGFLIWDINIAYTIATGNTIDETIKMYDEENTKIETNIREIVENYMQFEKDTYINLKDKDAMNLIQSFPQLNSDELVKDQIELFKNNNRAIISLKEDKIDLKRKRWLLYFGH